MESKKTFHLLTLIFSLLIIEKSMASRILTQYNPLPDDDPSRIGTKGSTLDKDGSWTGDSSEPGMLQVPPPATKTTINVWTAVSPTSSASRTRVSRSTSTSSTTPTGGGTYSKSSSTTVTTQRSSVTRRQYP